MTIDTESLLRGALAKRNHWDREKPCGECGTQAIDSWAIGIRWCPGCGTLWDESSGRTARPEISRERRAVRKERTELAERLAAFKTFQEALKVLGGIPDECSGHD